MINEVVVDVNHDNRHIEMNIHWAGGVHTPLRVRKNQPGKNGNATDSNIVGLVTELAKGWNDATRNNWNETRVKNLRRENEIPVFSKSQPPTWKTMLESSALLGVSNCVIRTMVRNNFLPARQIAKGAPWMIDDTDLERPAVRNYAKQASTGKSAPCDHDTQLLNL